MDVWEETEAKIKSDGDATVGKSSNKVSDSLCVCVVVSYSMCLYCLLTVCV